MLSLIYENPWTTIFMMIIATICLSSIIDALRGQ
ncbi:Uncharacterised protein [Enterobacter hormaechei]|nr:hypothetical protein AN2364V1_3231 [Enterobacter cloacae]CAH6326262.1 hypothetical protein AN2364V1_3231 [Enterobacter cloacae]CZZ94697.1 Uncharacterised protein [Enterobacter hormaechei]VAL05844.1 Uncharacterised protein [Enterobacter hormaechei]